MSAVIYKYQVIPLTEFYFSMTDSLGLWFPEKVIWQQQLQSFSCKHILLIKNYKYFHEFNNATILIGFCSVQKRFPLHYYIIQWQEHMELHSGSVQSFQYCSAVLTQCQKNSQLFPVNSKVNH